MGVDCDEEVIGDAIWIALETVPWGKDEGRKNTDE
jgi:hypothetical protein